jgi:polyisoprenoid-binding protein YceI
VTAERDRAVSVDPLIMSPHATCDEPGIRAALVPPGAWTVDVAASTVGFRVRHLGVATVRGHFTEFVGAIDSDAVGGSVQVASVHTGQPVRDDRLRSHEFFDADRFPLISFRTHAPLASPLSGNLTIRDVTRPVAFAVSASPADNASVHLRATATISRQAFGLTWAALVKAGRLIVSDRVDLVLDLALVPS